MSILIKGMKMPTSCLKGGCPLDGFACKLWEDKYWARFEDPEKMRHKNCPIIELSEHGDLIDRDELEDALMGVLFTIPDPLFGGAGVDFAFKVIGKAEPVIPEERSKGE